MSTPRSVYLTNAAIRMSYADATRSLEELIFDGVSAALQACGCTMDQVDSVVLASHDLIDGRSLSSMVTAPAAGAYLRDEIRLAEDGLAALALGAAKVAAGESRRCVVAAWGRSSETDTRRLPEACMDPFFEQRFGLTEGHVAALRYSSWLAAHGKPGKAKAEASERREARAKANPVCSPASSPRHSLPWPLEAVDAPPRADIVAATVLSASEGSFRITGIGQQTDTPRLGDRQWLAQGALRECVAQALLEAGRTLSNVDLIEVDALTLSEEAMALEALGLAQPGRGFDVYRSSDRINLSGGSAAGWCYPAMGMVRFAEVVRQMTRGHDVGLAVGSGPIGRQTHTAVVLEKA